MSVKTVLAFDLDGTLAPSKSTLPPQMAGIMAQILERYQVCVISGGKFDQFRTQLIDGLDIGDDLLVKLHIMPTCGTQYYRYDNAAGEWRQQYAENFTEDEKQTIIGALNDGIDHLGLREPVVYGEIIEDRGSQITFSALGQDIVAQLGDEGVRLKEAWDPDHAKKNMLRNYVAGKIPEFEVRVGGGTSIDITKPGIDKAYGMNKLMELLEVGKDEILFYGDRLQEGGNDYPVKQLGIESIEVRDWEETASRLTDLLQAK